MTKTFKEIINGIRTAILGIEVREDIAQGMEYVERFAETSTTKAQEAAESATAAERAKTDTLAAKTEAVQAISAEKQAGLDDISTAKSNAVKETKSAHTAALQDISNARAGALDDVAASTKMATDAASTAVQKAAAAAGSTSKAAESEKNAKAFANTAQEHQTGAESAQKKSEDAAKRAAAIVSTDKTLSTEGAPADAKATGDALEKKADKTEVSNALSQKSNTTHTHDLSALINTLSTGSATPQDADYYVSQYVGGGDTTTTYHRRPMSALWAYIKGKADVVFAAKSHTHNYAGSGSAGGSANSAVKLDTATAGSATKPVYISGGKPVACTYSLGKDVPANAVFTDHTYSAATQSAAGLMSAADKKRLDNLYQVGSIYQSTDPTSPAALFGGTWEQIASERVLMGASSSHKAGTTVKSGLPNITGTANGGVLSVSTPQSNGAFGATHYDSSLSYLSGDVRRLSTYNRTFDASRSNPIYGASDTVQPAAYYVYIWHRVA